MLRGKFSKLPPEIHLLIHCFCVLKNKLPPPAPPARAPWPVAPSGLSEPPRFKSHHGMRQDVSFRGGGGAEYPKNPSLQTVGVYRTPHRWSAFPQLSVLDRATVETNS